MDLEQVPSQQIVDAIEQLHAVNSVVLRELFAQLAVFHGRALASEDAAASTDIWVAARLRVSRSTAREWVRVAVALESLPVLAEAFGEGRVSFDQLRALTRIATPENEMDLLAAAMELTVAQVEALARKPRLDQDQESARSLWYWWDRDERFLHVKGRLPAADGAVVVKAFEREAELVPALPDGSFEPHDLRCADALVALASMRVAADADPDVATVVVHVDESLLVGGAGNAWVEGADVDLGRETLQRLCCDARIQTVTYNSQGAIVGIGRISQQVPRWLRRLVLRRDKHCVFPGCESKRNVHIHHIDWWSRGGNTDLTNLCALCHYHHKFVHEGKWTMRPRPGNNKPRFVRPDGHPWPTRPRPVRDDVRDRVLRLSRN